MLECALFCADQYVTVVPWLSSLHPPGTCTLYYLILRSSLIPTTLLRWNSCDEREAPDKRAHNQGSFFRSGTRMYSGHEDYGRGCKRWSTFFPLFSTSQDPPSLRQTPVWIADHLHPDFLRSRDDDDCVTMVVDVYSLASNPPEEPPCGPTNYAIQQNGQCLSHVVRTPVSGTTPSSVSGSSGLPTISLTPSHCQTCATSTSLRSEYP
jgi:hypothetical protein